MKINIKRRLWLVIIFVISYFSAISTTQIVNSNITQNTFWNYDTVLVTANITVLDNVTLTISSGTVVNLGNINSKFKIYGTVLAIASETDSIKFINGKICFDNSSIGANGTMNDNNKSIFKYCSFYKSGIGIFDFSNIQIENSSLTESSYNGEGIDFCYSGGVIYCKNSSPLVNKCKIDNNSISACGWGSFGAAIYCNNSSPIISNCLIYKNDFEDWYPIGRASGAGIYCKNNSNPEIRNCLLTENQSTNGINCNASNPTIINCTIANNEFADGITCYNSNPVLINTIIWTGLEFCDDYFPNPYVYANSVYIDATSNPEFYYCNIEGGPELFNGNGANQYSFDFYGNNNITENPYFILPEKFDYRLHPFSSSINNGTPDTTGLNLPEFDINGNVRITENRIDIGAFENSSFIDENVFGGCIYTNSEWNYDTIKITNDIVIRNNKTLTISPGTIVEFQGNYNIDVKGRIIAIGTPDQPIIFTVTDTLNFYNLNTPQGGWGGVDFNDLGGRCMGTDSSFFINCIFEYGKAVGSGNYEKDGGAICTEGFSALKIDRCIFRSNRAKRNGGAILCYEANSLITNSLFYSNFAGYDGGAVCYNSYSNNTCLFINNTVVNNSANYSGGGIWTWSNLKAVNSIFWGNTASSGDQIYSFNYYEVINCNMQNGLDGLYYLPDYILYQNCIESFPEFVDYNNNNFQLAPSSSLIDTGTNIDDFELSNFDLIGNQRIFGNAIDIGAYEYTTNIYFSDKILAADLNCEAILPDYTEATTFNVSQISQSPPVGTVVSGNENTVTLSIIDEFDNYLEISFNVIVEDFSPPAMPTLATLTDECSVTAIAPTTTDNCAGIIIGTTTDPTEYSEQGTYTITWTFADGNGNSTTAEQTFIIDDVTAPSPPTLTDVNSECSVTSLTAPTTTDNCTGTITGTTTQTFPITTQGTTVVTWTFNDGNGNTATQTQNVIVDDNMSPIPDIEILENITAECEVTELTAPTATDNCGGLVTVTNNATLPYLEQGTYQITWTYTDRNGNQSTQNQNIVIDDNIAPVPIVSTLPDITSQCEVSVLTAPSATDNCGGLVTVSNNAILPITTQGTNLITWTYDDGNGNQSTQNQNIIIDDTTYPEISCIENQTINLELGQTFYTVNGNEFNPISTSDNCQIVCVINNFNNTSTLSNVQLPVGLNTINWTITDIAENETTCSFDVQVNAFVGIPDLSENELTVYPNPTTGLVSIDISKVHNVTNVEITDITGKLISNNSLQINNSQLDVDLSGCSNGVYFINIQSQNKVYVTKVIKE